MNASISSRVRAFPWWVIALLVAVGIALLPQLGAPYQVIRQTELSLLLALIVGGLNLSLGFAGELAVGQVAMYAGGAYAAAIVAQHGHTDLILELLCGGVTALAIGILTGIPGLRLGSWSLAMTSFFLVLLIPDVIEIFSGQTGGQSGLSGYGSATLFGQILSPDGYLVAVVAVAVLWFAFLRNLVVSRTGIALLVLKQSPVLAASMGLSVFRMKLLAYALGAVPAGLAGVLFANLDLYVSPGTFSFSLATTALAASVIGGSTSVYGAVVGAFALQFGLNQSSNYEKYSLVVTGVLLVVGGVALTGGLAGLARRAASRLQPVLAGELDPAAPASEAVVGELPGAELSIAGVDKRFGGNRALDGVGLTARPGEITAVIGPNGSGKTTLMNLISGFYRPDAGSISLGGHELARRAPHRIAGAGVSRTFQTPNIPARISVLEAVAVGRYASDRTSLGTVVLRLPRFRRARRRDESEAMAALGAVGLTHLAHAEAAALPLGHRRLLEVARCLVGQPRVLLLDEVASGLDESEVVRLGAVLRSIRDAGATVVLVEHNFGLVMSIADRVAVLAQGTVIAHGAPEEIRRHPRVLAEYLGRTDEPPAPADGEGSRGADREGSAR